ncbi:MAG: hypothetical protein K2X99_04050 [Gemmatimonadaceae bacterium]|nr:hypothetical protein [Gemmatimonadaceae bacterium]
MTPRDPEIPAIVAALRTDSTRAVGYEMVDLIIDHLDAAHAGSGPVSGADPVVLADRFAEPLPRFGYAMDELLPRLRDEVLADVNRLNHPMYMGHQVSAPLAAAVWGELMIAATNNSLAVREMSPVGTAIERQVIRWMAELAAFPALAGGTFTSGGQEATLTALLAARAAAFPNAWRTGGVSNAVIVCGEHAHYAVSRAVGVMGLGVESVIAIPSREWRMDVAALDAQLDAIAREGRRVIAVVATAGSTATGSVDLLDAIADQCEGRGLWLHVDGAHGASALFSPRHAAALAGIARADSLAWDPHKMMLMPLSAGVVLVRDERRLDAAFAQHAPYLFHGAADERSRDQGVRSLMCSRRADALKVWVAFQRYGAEGIGAVFAYLADLTQALADRIDVHPEFEALHAPSSNILCFRHRRAGESPAQTDSRQRPLREAYNASGEGWITLTVLGGRPVLRVTLMNPFTTPAHLDALLAGLARTAEEL